MSEAQHVIAIVINHNSTDYLRNCTESLLAQSYENLEVIFIDNNSTGRDGLKLMHDTYDDNPRVTIIANTENKGYGKAANQGIRMALGRNAEFVSIVNPDIIFTEEYFTKILGRMNKDGKIASMTGKVYKYDFINEKPTDIIDSVGLFAYRNRRIIDDGQGMVDTGQFDKEKEVFGVSGACPIYRLDALEHVKVLEEYFDEDFFMYKEDTDLAWRFLLYGWKSLYYPEAVAYHGRGTGIQPRFSTKEILKNRKNLSRFQKKHAFRNQLAMQSKNDLWGNVGKDIFPIILRKTMLPFFMTFVEPYLWASYVDYLKLLPKIKKKRKIILANKVLSAKEMQKWFKDQSEYL